MYQLNGISGVTVSMGRVRRPGSAAIRVRLRFFMRKCLKSVRAGWVAWEEKWHEQSIRASEIERIRERDLARIHERLPMLKWRGPF